MILFYIIILINLSRLTPKTVRAHLLLLIFYFDIYKIHKMDSDALTLIVIKMLSSSTSSPSSAFSLCPPPSLPPPPLPPASLSSPSSFSNSTSFVHLVTKSERVEWICLLPVLNESASMKTFLTFFQRNLWRDHPQAQCPQQYLNHIFQHLLFPFLTHTISEM